MQMNSVVVGRDVEVEVDDGGDVDLPRLSISD